MPLLPAHIASMRSWLDLADEIIVVDSHSTDGTQEYLRENLRDHPAQIHTHPRGLYQSWNSAIQRATGRWLYIATVGDPITRDLLEHLLDTAESLQSDVLLGNPAFIDESDQPLPDFYWAPNEIADTLAAQGPVTFSGPAALFYAAKHLYTSALLGSCASNLYRTTHLQRFPFCTDFGMAGDAAWGIRHSLETSFASTRHPGSFFRVHRKSYETCACECETLEPRLHELVRETCSRQPASALLDQLKIPEMITHLTASIQLGRSLKVRRKQSRGPWYVHPALWRERSTLRSHRQTLDNIVNRSTTLIRESHTHRSPALTPPVSDRSTQSTPS